VSENKIAMIQKYNDHHGTTCRTITEIYNIEQSAPKAGAKLKVSETSIRNWVIKEGGKLNGRGGKRKRAPGLRSKLEIMDKDILDKMPLVALAERTGYSRSWCSVVLRSL